MKKTIAFIIPGIIALIPIGFAIALIVNIFCHNTEVFHRWLGFAYWALAALVILFAVWLAFRTYLKLLKIQQEQELKMRKAEDETKLVEGHNTTRMVIEKKEYKLRKKKAKEETLLKLVELLSDRKETKGTEEGKETKTVTVNFNTALLDDIKAIKLKWKELNDETT
jgi:uncharacterized membrane protein YcjF (UPF0283 family)